MTTYVFDSVNNEIIDEQLDYQKRTFNDPAISTVATGTAPFVIASTTVNTNLNADMVDGYHVGTSGSAIPRLDTANTWSNSQTFSASVATNPLVSITNSGSGVGLSVDDVAIGSSSSDQLLTINGLSGSARLISFRESDVTKAYVGLGTDNVLRVHTTGTDAVRLAANNIDYLSVTSAGRIGFRTTNPSTYFSFNTKVSDDNNYSYDNNTLYVVHQTATSTTVLNDPQPVMLLARQGTIGQAYGAAASFNISRYANNGVNSRTRLDISLAHNAFDVASNTALTLLSSGNVGIGTTSPSNLLQISSSLANKAGQGAVIGNTFVGHWSSNDSYAAFYHSSQSGNGYALLQYSSGETFLNAASGQGLNLRIGNANALCITASGNTINYGTFTSTGSITTTDGNIVVSSGAVGIGTVTPAAKLDVATAGSNGSLQTVLARMSDGSQTGDGTYLGIKAWSTQPTAYYGKGFSLEHHFYGDVNSSINFYRGSSTIGGYLAFAINDGTEMVWIAPTGKVGIGISSPDKLLHVSTTTTAEGAHIGSAFVGNWNGGATAAIFGHYTYIGDASDNYGLLQSSAGATYINSVSGNGLYLRIGNANVLNFTSAGHATFAGNLTVSGTASIATITNGLEIKYAGNGALEIGRKDGTDGTPYIDFHNGGNLDYDTRIISTGTSTTTGAATLQFEAGQFKMVGGDVVMPKTSGKGIKVDTTSPTFGWHDLIGEIVPKASGSGAPNRTLYRGNIYDFAFIANDVCDLTYHIPHDYVPGSDMYIHVHWSHTGTAISGSLVFTFYYTYAKGHNQADFPADKNITITPTNLAATPQYRHRIDEAVFTSTGGSATLLDNSLIEVDGLILAMIKVTTLPTITSGSLFIHTVDVHYQSTGIPTKAKVPNFYT